MASNKSSEVVAVPGKRGAAALIHINKMYFSKEMQRLLQLCDNRQNQLNSRDGSRGVIKRDCYLRSFKSRGIFHTPLFAGAKP